MRDILPSGSKKLPVVIDANSSALPRHLPFQDPCQKIRSIGAKDPVPPQKSAAGAEWARLLGVMIRSIMMLRRRFPIMTRRP
jgi:hypothetical protein